MKSGKYKIDSSEIPMHECLQRDAELTGGKGHENNAIIIVSKQIESEENNASEM